MQKQNIRDSIYEIQPWNEQSSRIPDKFLTANHFAKTSNNHKPTFNKGKNLQIATNSVYFIKHNQEEPRFTAHYLNKYQRTTQNSPKSNNKQVKKIPTEHIKQVGGMRATRSTSKLFQKKEKNPMALHLFKHTKKIIFEIKPLNNKGKMDKVPGTIDREEKFGLNRNLSKMYERSTVTSDQKKKENFQLEQIDSILVRRKMKTQKEDHSPSNIQSSKLLTKNSSEFKKEILYGSKYNLTIGTSLERSKINTQTSQKMKIQLFMQRKLYLMKDQYSKWKDIKQTLPLSPNKKY